MKTKPKTIVLDADDTLVQFVAPMLRLVNLLNDTRITVDDITEKVPHVSLEEIIPEEIWVPSMQFFEDGGGYATLTPMDGVRTSLERLKAAGHKIIIVTARPRHFHRQTELCMALNKLPYDKIYYTPKGKGPTLAKLKPDIFLDDHPGNLHDALKFGVPLENLYLVNQPWNATETKFKRVGSLMQLERLISGELSKENTNE